MMIALVPEGEQELTEIAQFYTSEVSIKLGRAFLAEFANLMELILAHPQIGSPWREKVRRVPLRRFPYSIIYQPQEPEIRVLAIAHQRRKPSYWHNRI